MMETDADTEDVTYGTELVEDNFGFHKRNAGEASEIIRRFTLSNKSGMSVQVITFGATITSVKVPDANGVVEDVTLGFDDLKGYLDKSNPYMGATIGRVANRIGNAHLTLDGKDYKLRANAGSHQLHGGLSGFDKKVWESHVEGNKVTMSYVSRDGEEGYPGEVSASVTFQLTSKNELVLDMVATTTKKTPINLTNHAYFNLAGHNATRKALYEHVAMINANSYTPLNADSIATGEIKSVTNTPYDLTQQQALGQAIPLMPGDGYDINYCINTDTANEVSVAARMEHPPTGRVLLILTNQPGVQFYTANFFPDDDSLKGKEKSAYGKHGAFALETQGYPNAVNVPSFPSVIVSPGETYRHRVIYHFFTYKDINTWK